MWKIFKRRKGGVAAAQIGWNRLGQWMDDRQRKAADWLNARSRRYPVRQVALLVMLLCMLLAGCSLYILYQAFY